jgi:hypothetical protein
LTVKEISQKTELSTRHIRRIISQLSSEHTTDVLHKNNKDEWRVHHLLFSKFKPKRIRKCKYYALTIDPCRQHLEAEIHEIMKFVVGQMPDENLELNYVIEAKKATGINHIHCFIRCNNRKRLLEVIRMAFSEVSYKEAVMYDLNGWKSYITKENDKIITLNKKTKNENN